MPVLASLIATVFVLTFLAAPGLGGGWFWDIGAGLGFLALAGMLAQMLPWRASNGVRAHERLGYAVLGVAIAHAFWLLGGDGAVRVYLRLDAPLHMWLGVGALLGLGALTLLARMPDRRALHRDHRSFRRAHRLLGLGVVGGATGHVVLSRFYLETAAQIALLVALVLAIGLGRRHLTLLGPERAAPVGGFLAAGAVAIGVFVAARSLLA